MVNRLPSFSHGPNPYKFARANKLTTQNVPKTVVGLGALKLLENRLRSRKLLSFDPQADFYPLWFLAETERNVFLWRNQFSLEDISLFEFCVDIPALIEKRVKRLSDGNVFNAALEDLPHSPDLIDKYNKKEIEYLLSFKDYCENLTPHLNALCRAALSLEIENGGSNVIGVIILPSTAPMSL